MLTTRTKKTPRSEDRGVTDDPTHPRRMSRLITKVEMGGIEPPSDVVLSGLLRAQFASDFLGPSYPANK